MAKAKSKQELRNEKRRRQLCNNPFLPDPAWTKGSKGFGNLNLLPIMFTLFLKRK